MRRLVAGALVLLSLMSAMGSPRAQPAPEGPPGPLALVRRANRLFELGRFAEALVLYERAYEQTERPAWLFNIAQCHRELGHATLAIRTYELYLAKGVHDAATVEEVRALIARTRAQQAPVIAPRPPPVEPSPPQRPFYRRWWFWTVLAAVAGGITAGIVVGSRRVCVSGTAGCP